MNLLHVVGGLVLLVLGADLIVRGAPRLALSFGISPLVVGLNIVAFGTGALIVPLVVNIQLIRQEVPIMIGASLLLRIVAGLVALVASEPSSRGSARQVRASVRPAQCSSSADAVLCRSGLSR